MDAFIVHYKSSSTVVDSIKIFGAITYSYSLLYPDNLHNFLNSDISVSNLMPFYKDFMFPFPFLDLSINKDDNIKNRREFMKNRKNKPAYVFYNDLKNIIENHLEINNNSTNKQKDFENGVNLSPVPVSITGNHIFEKAVNINNKMVYNEVFTREMFRYPESYFIIIGSDRKIINALAMLNDFGISGRISSGSGQVNIKIKEFPYNVGYNGPGFYILLSSFMPDEDSLKYIDFKKSRYRMDIFQGISKDGMNIGPYRYFRAGSLFYINENINGKLVRLNNRVINFNPVIMKVVS